MKKGAQGHRSFPVDDPTGSYDTAEEIKGCLNCCLKECRNCSSRRKLRRGLPDFDYDLLLAYIQHDSDVNIAKSMKTTKYREITHREALGLPDPATVTYAERVKYVKEKLEYRWDTS